MTAQPPYTYRGQAPRKIMQDRSLPHQIRLLGTGPGHNLIGVSCNCLPNGWFLAVRHQGDAAADLAVWRKHMQATEKTP